MTILAVLHYIEHIDEFIKNLAKITRYIYIRDNDMITHTSYDMVEIQHELYEGILYPNNRSPLYRLNKYAVIKKLKQYEFTVFKDITNSAFARPCMVLLKKQFNIYIINPINNN